MGVILETSNPHLSIELRRESFFIHDDELTTESPEFGYERVFGLQGILEQILEHPRFIRWLNKREGR